MSIFNCVLTLIIYVYTQGDQQDKNFKPILDWIKNLWPYI